MDKERLILQERITQLEVPGGEKFQVGNKVSVSTVGNKCVVTVQTGVIFLKDTWAEKSIRERNMKASVQELQDLMYNARAILIEYLKAKKTSKGALESNVSEYEKEKSHKKTEPLSPSSEINSRVVSLAKLVQKLSAENEALRKLQHETQISSQRRNLIQYILLVLIILIISFCVMK